MVEQEIWFGLQTHVCNLRKQIKQQSYSTVYEMDLKTYNTEMLKSVACPLLNKSLSVAVKRASKPAHISLKI